MLNILEEIDKYKNSYYDIIDNYSKFTFKNKSINIEEWVSKVLENFIYLKKNKYSISFIGNGASCSMASHFAADFTKNAGITAFSNNEGALLTCFSNDFSFETSYMEILKRHMNDHDTLIAISSSGQSKNILNAVKFVSNNYKNSTIITLSGFNENNPLRKSGDYNLYLNCSDYGFVESIHAYYLHMLIDMFIKNEN